MNEFGLELDAGTLCSPSIEPLAVFRPARLFKSILHLSRRLFFDSCLDAFARALSMYDLPMKHTEEAAPFNILDPVSES
jgi:hypothetical protein